MTAAKRCFCFFHKLHQHAWLNFASCKTMWAGAELYRITGDEVYLDTCTRLADHYVDTQKASGAWVHTLWYQSEKEQAFTWTSDITHEYGAEFADVIYDLACRSADLP